MHFSSRAVEENANGVPAFSPGLAAPPPTLGKVRNAPNPNGVASIKVRGFNPAGVGVVLSRSQGSRSCVAPTLGWKIERRWRSDATQDA
jgi:hypothetical protein